MKHSISEAEKKLLSDLDKSDDEFWAGARDDEARKVVVAAVKAAIAAFGAIGGWPHTLRWWEGLDCDLSLSAEKAGRDECGRPMWGLPTIYNLKEALHYLPAEIVVEVCPPSWGGIVANNATIVTRDGRVFQFRMARWNNMRGLPTVSLLEDPEREMQKMYPGGVWVFPGYAPAHPGLRNAWDNPSLNPTKGGIPPWWDSGVGLYPVALP